MNCIVFQPGNCQAEKYIQSLVAAYDDVEGWSILSAQRSRVGNGGTTRSHKTNEACDVLVRTYQDQFNSRHKTDKTETDKDRNQPVSPLSRMPRVNIPSRW